MQARDRIRQGKSSKTAPSQLARRARLGNPSGADQAAALSEKFHGRPARTVREVTETRHERTHLTDLGTLVEIAIVTDDHKTEHTIRFKEGTRLAASPDGAQLYFVGGDQEIPLKTLGLAGQLPKDYVDAGTVRRIVYRTRKGFDDFQEIEYVHRMGEKGGRPPRLGYDTRNKLLFLTGGTYQVKTEGIIH